MVDFQQVVSPSHGQQLSWGYMGFNGYMINYHGDMIYIYIIYLFVCLFIYIINTMIYLFFLYTHYWICLEMG